jgi:hypothetical protein
MSSRSGGGNHYNDLAEIRGTSIPMFNQHGTALSQEEREAIAKKKGVCVKCGIKTHEVKMFKRIALTADHVYEGKCIRCNNSSVPHVILMEWEKKFKPVQTPGLSANSKFRNAGRLAAMSTQVSRPGGRGGQQQQQAPPRSQHNMNAGPRSTMNASSRSSVGGQQGYSHSNQLRPREGAPRPKSNNSISSGHGNNNHSAPTLEVGSALPRHSSHRNVTLNNSGSTHNNDSNTPPAIAVGSEVIINEDYTGGGNSNAVDAWAIMKALRENKNAPEILRQNLHRLRNIGHEQAGALHEIKELMGNYRNDPRMMTACAGALWGVTAVSDEKKSEAADCGAISTLIDALKNPASNHDPDFVQWALGAICCLARGDGNREVIADAEGIEVILESMERHSTSAGVFEWFCRALHSLVYQTDREGLVDNAEDAIKNNIVSIDECGGFPVILAAMKSHPSETIPQLWAVKLLWRLQDRDGNEASSARVAEKIVKEGGLGACVKVLKARSTSAQVYEETAGLLYHLLLHAGSESIEQAADCMVTTIRKMSENQDQIGLQEVCCNLLSLLVSTNRLQFKESEGLKAIIQAMSASLKTVSLQRAAANALWNVSYIPAFFDLSYLDDALSAVEAAQREFPDDVELLIVSCGFIANAATTSSASGAGLPYKIPLHAFTLEEENTQLSVQAGRALGNICIQFPKYIKKIMDSKGLEALVSCLSSSSPHVLQARYSALIAIANVSDDNKKTLMTAGVFDLAKEHIQSCVSIPLTEKALEMMSVIACPEKRSPMPLPGDIFQVITQTMRTQLTSAQSLEQACCALRNLLVVSTPGATSLNFDGFVDYMTELINTRTNPVDLKREACGVLWALTVRHTKQSAHDLTTMFKAILGVMGLYKGEDQQYNSALQSIAAGALSSITACIRDTTIPLAPDEVEEIIAVMYMVMEYDLDNIDLLEKFLEVVLNLSFVDEAIVIQCGGIVVVIDAMVEHEQAETIQERGCAILALLSSTENLQVNLCIAETDGIDMIVSALAIFATNPRIQVDACKALSHLSVDHESRMLIASQGGLILIVNAMNSSQDNVDLLEGACSALLNLSSDAEEQVLSDSNVVETVVNLMKYHPDAMRLQEKALGVLQNVSMRNASAKQSIAEAGGINAVIVALKEYMGTPTVLERAFTTMWSLAVLERNQIGIANAGGIGLVVNGMMANINHSKVQKQACGCLCTLSSNSRNKTLIREAGGVDAIVFAMWAHYDSEVLQIEACRALSSLAVNVQTNEVMIVTDGEINAIISAMRLFPESQKLQEHGCVALRNFMLSADNAELIRTNSAELQKLMTHAAERFPEKCSERANQVMAGL